MTTEMLNELWNKTVRLSWQIPHCYRSQRYQYRDAADQIEKEENLSGEDLVQFRSYVDEKTRFMSNYSGD